MSMLTAASTLLQPIFAAKTALADERAVSVAAYESKPVSCRKGRRAEEKVTATKFDKGRKIGYKSAMPRPKRYAPGGMVFHVLNRGVGRRVLFDKPEDFSAFERVMRETLCVRPMRVCAYCLLPNHWHLVLWPENDGDLSAFMQQLTNTHVKRWKEHRRETGYGHLYQGRYKSFPVQTDDYFYQAIRYVERNALRARLVERAESWRWSSLGCLACEDDPPVVLSSWPMPRPANWVEIVNQPQTETELATLRHCVNRGAPYGDDRWIAATSKLLALESTLRPRGRPKKEGQHAER